MWWLLMSQCGRLVPEWLPPQNKHKRSMPLWGKPSPILQLQLAHRPGLSMEVGEMSAVTLIERRGGIPCVPTPPTPFHNHGYLILYHRVGGANLLLVWLIWQQWKFHPCVLTDVYSGSVWFSGSTRGMAKTSWKHGPCVLATYYCFQVMVAWLWFFSLAGVTTGQDR